MAEYYLISQLPSLDGISEASSPSITEEKFIELCHSSLKEKTLRKLSSLTLVPSKSYEKSGSSLIDAWNDGERNLRFALGQLRAKKMNKLFVQESSSLSSAVIQAAQNAVEFESPMEAEKFLNKFRLDFLETLRPLDSFSEDYIFYYYLKLKLIFRIRQFDTESGKSAYKKIYGSVISGEGSEVIQ